VPREAAPPCSSIATRRRTVTRGQRLVVVVGQPKALVIAVEGARARRRWSKLDEDRLGGAPEPARRPATKTLWGERRPPGSPTRPPLAP
jgi:hypothetical protein